MTLKHVHAVERWQTAAAHAFCPLPSLSPSHAEGSPQPPEARVTRHPEKSATHGAGTKEAGDTPLTQREQTRERGDSASLTERKPHV